MRLTENMIIARSKQSDLGTIKRINLWGCDLTDISIVENMTNVEVLALSINNLSSLQPLESCAKLQVLYLRKNNIADFNELKYLQNLPMLTELWLAENPCAVQAGSTYRARVLTMLPNLKKLDDEEVSRGDIEAANKLMLESMTSKRVSKENSPVKVLSPRRETKSDQVEIYENPIPVLEFFGEVPNSEIEQKIENCYLMQQQQQQQQIHQLKQQQQGEVTPTLRGECYASQPQLRTPSQQCNPSEQMSPTFQPKDHFGSQRSLQSLPISFAPEGGADQLEDLQMLNKAQSMGQVPQLKLIVQIQPTQGAMDQSVNIDYSTANEHPASDETPRNRYDSVSERVVFANRNTSAQQFHHGSHTSRTRTSQGVYRDSGCESAPNGNEDPNIRSPKSQRHYVSYDGAQTNRSINNLSNFNWEDGEQTNRSSSSRASGTTATPHNSKSSRRNANVLSALLCVIPELDIRSLQVLEHSIQCRLDELNDDLAN